MGKSYSSRRLLFGAFFLLLFFVYAALLRLNVSPPIPLWRLQVLRRNWPQSLSVTMTNDTMMERKEYPLRFILRRLVRGTAQRELDRNRATCISDTESDICITTDTVAITINGPNTVVHLTNNQRLSVSDTFSVRPYARKTDTFAMSRTSPIKFIPNNPPKCDLNHSFPAVVFSTGGFAGNFFHDINDVLIPLFMTTSHLHSQLHLVITDYEEYWVRKYSKILARISKQPIIIPSSSPLVHCFPAAVVGLKYHGNLLCNASLAPGGLSTSDFGMFLKRSFSLSQINVRRPFMILLSRKKSRTLLNEDSVIRLAESAGFNVLLATSQVMKDLEKFAELLHTCDVLLGVHGAGMTNMVFMKPGAIIVQIVPWGLDWAAAAYYGRPARRLGLEYVEYHIKVEESSLYEKYEKDDPVIVDPWGINLKGYNVSKPIYTDGQNVTLDLGRFRDSLVDVKGLIRN